MTETTTEDLKDLTGEETLADAQKADAGLPQEPTEEEGTPEDNSDVPEKLRKYVKERWHGKPNFECPHSKTFGGKQRPCRFKTVDPALFAEHMDKVHPAAWLEE